MSVNKTQPSADGVAEFLAGIANPDVRASGTGPGSRWSGTDFRCTSAAGWTPRLSFCRAWGGIGWERGA